MILSWHDHWYVCGFTTHIWYMIIKCIVWAVNKLSFRRKPLHFSCLTPKYVTRKMKLILVTVFLSVAVAIQGKLFTAYNGF